MDDQSLKPQNDPKYPKSVRIDALIGNVWKT